ncbi:cell division protein FtsQ/DivIB [Cognatiyoonia sp. IB215182]|uniref:cell division protein FtsQ/DivIB n=1 Tax=Cognatiyoonia sp. IB215182 TaxID=3097353 RepID=UPI002A146E6E|nr:cell division protein FtsQ/DivIB [Cognatiyoonia sp. IB215182]MDX8351315.1 cell division protein FtsQ/DivIB [Cognatiyoonia sp. IB215182]
MRSLIRRAFADNAPRDPAPSKLDYKWQRLMLTPGFRATVRIGVPILLIMAIIGSWYSKPENRAALAAQIASAKQSFQERPQFMVQRLNITGADGEITAAVRDLLPSNYPMSSFDLDLEEMRAAIEALDPIKSASVRVGQAGTLDVRLTPRLPAALWRDGATLRLIDGDGVRSGTVAARADRLDLPLIAGDGAEQKIAEALALYAGSGPLRERVRGLVRMGERRWDIVLDRDQRILLPGDGAVAALDRVIALNEAQDMLSRDVAVVDMRNAERPTLRMNEEAALALRRVNTTINNNGAEN